MFGDSLFCVKQVGWVENDRAGKLPQREAEEKQVSWVENDRTGKFSNRKLRRSRRVG